MSDIHFGSRETDLNLVKKDFDLAKKHNSRILINGDLFEAIYPKDKRSTSQTSAPSKTDTLIQNDVKMAFSFLRPYAHLIDMISVGNHEDKILTEHYFDMGLALLDKFEDTGIRNIAYGGYSGVVRYHLKSGDSFIIHYHHGSIKASVGKGINDFGKQSNWMSGADLYWRGHHHNKVYFRDAQFNALTGKATQRMNVMTASYKQPNHIETSAKTKKDGSTYNWPERCNFPLQGLGGFQINVSLKPRQIQLIDTFN
ncbi:MAG: hypothetical protein ACRC78_17960 [Planktothrix sp.]